MIAYEQNVEGTINVKTRFVIYQLNSRLKIKGSFSAHMQLNVLLKKGHRMRSFKFKP